MCTIYSTIIQPMNSISTKTNTSNQMKEDGNKTIKTLTINKYGSTDYNDTIWQYNTEKRIIFGGIATVINLLSGPGDKGDKDDNMDRARWWKGADADTTWLEIIFFLFFFILGNDLHTRDQSTGVVSVGDGVTCLLFYDPCFWANVAFVDTATVGGFAIMVLARVFVGFCFFFLFVLSWTVLWYFAFKKKETLLVFNAQFVIFWQLCFFVMVLYYCITHWH